MVEVHVPGETIHENDTQLKYATLPGGRLLLDRYRVLDVIALGSSSAIYRAEDERLSRVVCIKMLRHGRATGGIQRTTFDHFMREAFALSRLAHPNTIRIYDFGKLDQGVESEPSGTPFHVIEYIDGGTLAQRVRTQGTFGKADTARLVTALAGALSEAHSVGIVHRDVKPNNILLVGSDNTCTPKLADFGIAKTNSQLEAPEQFRAEDTEIVAGQDVRLYSMYWAAPEQFLSLGVTPAADVYSLALVTVFMLTGRVVLHTDDSRMPLVMRKHVQENLAHATESLDADQSLHELLSQACAFDVTERLSDVQEFAGRLREILVGDVVIVGESLIQSATPVASRSDSTGDMIAVPEPIHEPTRLLHEPAVDPVAPLVLKRNCAPFSIGDRAIRLIYLEQGRSAIDVNAEVRLRINLMDADGERPWIHIKGLNCFICSAGGRPSVAVHAQRNEVFELLSTQRRILGSFRLRTSIRDARYHNFSLADHNVAIDAKQHSHAVALDFGVGAPCIFVVQGVQGV